MTHGEQEHGGADEHPATEQIHAHPEEGTHESEDGGEQLPREIRERHQMTRALRVPVRSEQREQHGQRGDARGRGEAPTAPHESQTRVPAVLLGGRNTSAHIAVAHGFQCHRSRESTRTRSRTHALMRRAAVPFHVSQRLSNCMRDFNASSSESKVKPRCTEEESEPVFLAMRKIPHRLKDPVERSEGSQMFLGHHHHHHNQGSLSLSLFLSRIIPHLGSFSRVETLAAQRFPWLLDRIGQCPVTREAVLTQRERAAPYRQPGGDPGVSEHQSVDLLISAARVHVLSSLFRF